MPLEKQFGNKIINKLEVISKNIGKDYKRDCEIRQFNWKLSLENLRDPLHVIPLHSATLGKVVDFSEKNVQQIPLKQKLRKFLLSDASSFSKDGETKVGKGGSLLGLFKPSLESGYHNCLLFPNFHLATPDGGRSFSIESLNPQSPSTTAITKYVFCNQPIQASDVFMEEVLEHRMRGLNRVLKEDYDACEEIQIALGYTQLEQNIGAYEHVNVNIASLYRRIIRQ